MSATNGWGSHISTDDYDFYGASGVESPRPGRQYIDGEGQIKSEHYFFPLSAKYHTSVMDPDPNNTGPTNDFWTDYPIVIDVNGDIYYDGENTGINLRGPASAPRYVSFDELTEEEKQSLKGADGRNGLDGRNGQDGADGAVGPSAFEEWAATQPGSPTLNDFYAYIASFVDYFIKQGTGNGSLLLNYKGLRNIASGEGSTAAGENTEASGKNSFAMGNHTVAAGVNQLVIGKYNENSVNNLFEIGNGTNSERKTIFNIDTVGNLSCTGEIRDNANNILSHKVDQIEGKQLSTNDFTNEYKNFIDNYHIDTALSPSSRNPVENQAVYEEINSIRLNNQKPTVVSTTTENKSYPILFLEAKESSLYDVSEKLSITKYISDFTWNPTKKIFNNSAYNSINSTAQNVFLFGTNLSNNSDWQYLIGKNNVPNANHIFQIGNGESNNNRANAFAVTRTGDIIAGGDVQNSNGDLLSHKQEILDFDNVPTENSDAVISSGNLYDFFVANNWDENLGFYPADLTTAINNISTIQSQILAIQTQIATLQTQVLHEITDDTTNRVYLFGIDNGEFYIKPKPVVESEEEEEEE